jgi:glycosyltransferase involved in cell wall biosynthesis
MRSPTERRRRSRTISVTSGMSTEDSGLLFVLPVNLSRSAGVDAVWLTAANLSRAVGKLVGGAQLLTPEGLLSPDEVEALAVHSTNRPSARRRAAGYLPRTMRIGIGDLRAWLSARRMRARVEDVGGRRFRFVMQMHHRFQDCGARIADKIGVPFVLRVEALEVREEATWGLRRPIWGRFVERLGELRVASQADLVACVSKTVDADLAALGIPHDRRIVLPSAVDLEVFCPGPSDEELSMKHDLAGRFVVGWVGGFRPFHGLEHVPSIARLLRTRIPNAVLCLVGAGPLRDDIAKETKGLKDHIRLLPPVRHADIPKWLRRFDACLLLAGPQRFHYSPLKLYEYMACGRPVVAAAIGEVQEVIADGENGLLFERGDAEGAVEAIGRLVVDEELRTLLSRNARITAERKASWAIRAEGLLSALQRQSLGAVTQAPHNV